MNKQPAFIIDSSVMVDIIEGNNKQKAGDLFKKIKEMNIESKELVVFTPLSSLLRAIYLADPKTPIENLQELIEELRVMPSFADFKNKDSVRDEAIGVAKALSGDENEQ